MESTMYFKKFEVIGKTKDEAIATAKELNLMVDATQSYKKWAEKHSTNEDDVNDYLKEYLLNKKYNKPGLGAYIVLQAGKQDLRERPYKITKIKYPERTHSPKKVYVGRAQDTNEELFIEKTEKAATQAAKEWIKENQRGVNLFVEARFKENNALYAKVDYTPTTGTKPYKLLVFGYVKA